MTSSPKFLRNGVRIDGPFLLDIDGKEVYFLEHHLANSLDCPCLTITPSGDVYVDNPRTKLRTNHDQ